MTEPIVSKGEENVEQSSAPKIIILLLIIALLLITFALAYYLGWIALIILFPVTIISALLIAFWRRPLLLPFIGYTTLLLLLLLPVTALATWASEPEPVTPRAKSYFWQANSDNGLVVTANFDTQFYLSRRIPPPEGSTVLFDASASSVATRNLLDGQRLSFICANGSASIQAKQSFVWPRTKSEMLLRLPVSGWQLLEEPTIAAAAPDGIWCGVYNRGSRVFLSLFPPAKPRYGATSLPPRVKDSRKVDEDLSVDLGDDGRKTETIK